MYFPYLRGKQYELVMLREQAELIGRSGKIIPIIEPVKENLNPLDKALKALVDSSAKPIIIVNPVNGDFANDTRKLVNYLHSANYSFYVGIVVTESFKLNELQELLDIHATYEIAIIHQGFTKGKELSEILKTCQNIAYNIFVSKESNKLYQKHFKGIGARVLVRNGFNKRKNANYPENEHFSDLHITFDEEGMDGFGDFLIVGDDYSESGGPAWAVAIHMSYLDGEKNMFIKHYVSDRRDDNKDAGGKFLEALGKLVNDEKEYTLFDTEASKEYLDLFEKQLFRGLGYAKKLSMQNHLETVARHLEQ